MSEEIATDSSEATESKDPVASLTEDLQRLQAEYLNYKKRVDRDRILVADIATGAALIELLPILDDLDRAAEHGELTGGFKAIADQISNFSQKLGLEKFGEAPSNFDPNMHETSKDVKETTVTKILQPGYKHKERVLRPARVVVTDPEHGS